MPTNVVKCRVLPLSVTSVCDSCEISVGFVSSCFGLSFSDVWCRIRVGLVSCSAVQCRICVVLVLFSVVVCVVSCHSGSD